MTVTALISQARTRSRPMLWIYLLLICVAEYVTAAISPQAGLTVHALILTALVLQATFAPDAATRTLMSALTLAPLIRLLSLSLPLPSFRQLYWYPVVSIPLLIATSLLIWQSRMPRAVLGLRRGNLALQLMIMCGGVGLGALEYSILQPGPLIRPFSWTELVIGAVILMVFTGFTEELIFRGVLQSLAIPVLGRWALLYVALLFAVLHIGYLSLLDVIFVFGVGIVFAYLARWSGSILGVTLAHGLTNIFLFLVMPYAAEGASAELNQVLPLLAALTSALAFIAIGVLAWQAHALGKQQNTAPARVANGAPEQPAPVLATVRTPAPLPLQPAPVPAQAPSVATRPITTAGIATESPLDVYRRLSGEHAAPLMQVRVEDAGLGLRALLFVPVHRLPHAERLSVLVHGTQLPKAGRLLPPQYDFVVGVVEFDKLPDTARGAQARSMALYRASRLLAREIRRELDTLASDRPEVFQSFWAEHGGYFGIGPWLPRHHRAGDGPALPVASGGA